MDLKDSTQQGRKFSRAEKAIENLVKSSMNHQLGVQYRARVRPARADGSAHVRRDSAPADVATPHGQLVPWLLIQLGT